MRRSSASDVANLGGGAFLLLRLLQRSKYLHSNARLETCIAVTAVKLFVWELNWLEALFNILFLCGVECCAGAEEYDSKSNATRFAIVAGAFSAIGGDVRWRWSVLTTAEWKAGI